MRLVMFFLLFPVWAAAQPAMVNPAQVVGFARADLNEDGYDERFLLVLDDEGGIDLFIFHEITGTPTVFVDNFIETTRYAPTISLVGSSSIGIELHSIDGLGSHIREWSIGWDWQNGGYILVGLGIETTPRMADEDLFTCGIDFLVGGVRTVKGDEHSVTREIGVPPSPLLDPVPEATLTLCYE